MSLDNRIQANEPLSGTDELLDLFRQGEKPRERFRVGLEFEKVGLLAGTQRPIPYAGPRGLEELLSRLPRFGYQPFLERGHPIAATQRAEEGAAVGSGELSISLEPGGQLELSGRPFHCACDLSRELGRHLAVVRALGAELGHEWLGVGYRPFGDTGDAEWMPKGRYVEMRRHLGATGALGLDMMTMTATVQASFDYSDEADMARKLRGATAVSPLITALFANSPLRGGKESGYLSFRAHVWREVDPLRCGPLEAAFRPGFGYQAYADWALDVPMIFLRRAGRYRDPRGATFRRFLAEGLDGERATLSDWEDHLTTLFPEVRLKRVLEMRGADSGSRAMCAALAALWKGILYSPASLDAARHLVPLPYHERLELHAAVAREALAARVGSHTVRDLARELVEIATQGLGGQGACGAEEPRFLDPLREILEDGRCPAEVALARLHGEFGGDPGRLVQHWRVA